MILTAYSVFSAMLWFSAFAIVVMLLIRKDAFVLRFGLLPLICLIVTTVLRLFLPLEFSFTKVIRSTHLLPTFFNTLQSTLFSIRTWEIRVSSLLLLVWGLVTLILLLRYVIKNHRHAKWLDCCEVLYERGQNQEISEWCGQEVRILKSEDTFVPYVCGFTQPTVILANDTYTKEELHFILLHEMQHFNNRDQWSKLLMQLLCFALWWNPIVYLLKRQLDQTLELRCDFGVLSRLARRKRRRYYDVIFAAYKRGYEKKQKRLKKREKNPSYLPTLTLPKRRAKVAQRFNIGLSYKELENQKGTARIVLCVVVALMYLASYTVVFQPWEETPVSEDGFEYHVDFPDDSYLVEMEDGRYGVYMNDEFTGTIDDLTVEPFCSFPIRK